MIRSLVRKLHRQYKSSDDLFRKRVKFGEINKFFGRIIISSDTKNYTLPFLTNPFRAQNEKDFWVIEEPIGYEYDEATPHGKTAMRSFDLSYELLKNRISKDAVIFDIGCNSGYFLGKWQDKGFRNLHGIDPQKTAVAYAKTHRPDINIWEGFFDQRSDLMQCDVLTFYQTIYRIPYEDRLFETIDSCAKEYVLVAWIEEAANGRFPRDLHLGMSKVGFICVEKRVVNMDFQPYGTSPEDKAMIAPDKNGEMEPEFISFFLFRRVEPRK